MVTGQRVVDPTDVGMSAERIDLVRRLMADHVASGRTPSVAALVLRRGEIVLEEAHGVQGPDGPALTVDHSWPIASAGKPMLAAVVMAMAEDGLLGVMEPITEFLPEFAGTEWADVLVHHLLTHTAGWASPLFSGRLYEALMAGEYETMTEGIRALAFDPVRLCGIGEKMCYGNANYLLLSEIVRRITGTTLDAEMRRRLFEPLGMTRSALIVGDDLVPHLVTRAPDVPLGADTPFFVLDSDEIRRYDGGEMGVHASVRDVATFGQMILDGGAHGGERVLAPTSVAAMCTDQIPGIPAHFGVDRDFRTSSWGYGFSVICEQRWPYFGGGLCPPGTVTHPGVGGVDFWVDFHHEIVGVFFEVCTELGPTSEPVSGLCRRVQDVVTGAVR